MMTEYYMELAMWASRYSDSQACWEFWQAMEDFRNNAAAIARVTKDSKTPTIYTILEDEQSALLISIHPKGGDPVKYTFASITFDHEKKSIEGCYFVPVMMLENVVAKQRYVGRRVAKRFEFEFIQTMKIMSKLNTTRTLRFYMDASVIIVGLVPMLLIDRARQLAELPKDQRESQRIDKSLRGLFYNRKSGKLVTFGIHDDAQNKKVPAQFSTKIAEWTAIEIGNQEKEDKK